MILMVGLFAIGFAMSGTAGSINNSDADSIPDVFDNCSEVDNEAQTDVGGDGFGNVCDADFTGDLIVGGTDFGLFVTAFGGTDFEFDLTDDGIVGGTDFGRFVALFGPNPPGPGATAL